MTFDNLPDAYIDCLRTGPFARRVDPWAEDAHYFQQIHASMIDQIISQTSPALLKMGYRAGREASLQIAEGREPDLSIQRAMNVVQPEQRWDYELAAEELLAAAGIAVESEVDLQALHISELGSGRLVTVMELISPGNKARPSFVDDYRARRERLLFERHVNIVEIDLTRSVKRLLKDEHAARFPYHVAVFLPSQSPRFIGIELEKSLARIALPLRGKAIAAELQRAYDDAYRLWTIAAQIDDDVFYTEATLPFPSLLTDAQRKNAIQSIATWKAELERLRS